ncbi:Glucose oxidase [Cytospora mali]|uniref:Glucose oxidase n=1 Tax=Cytospora mali TaxID=578113 RepID=A0A194UWY7_CYTMA|nr:Glucose oxidase [Valsa mali var. pyri (nom. inval.)]
MKFDYVIVGGGTCGLLVANRLSEDPSTTVAVIEPGQDVRNNPNVTDPANFLVPFNTPIDWAYPTIAQPGASNRTLTFHSGKAIGGTSTINGMTYIRADAAEIDAWEALGDEGWNWDTLFPYYKKVEKFTLPTTAQVAAGAHFEPQYHGEDGDLHVGYRYALANGSFHGVVQDTWGNMGYPENSDVNSGVTRGFDVWPQTIDRDLDLRWDAARAYFYPVEDRANLRILRGTAIKLVWNTEDDGRRKRASGVEYKNANNETTVVGIGKEAILSGGSLRTPLVLELSGIGNRQLLDSLGIRTVIDLVGVGENLQEQPNSVSLLGLSNTLNVTGATTYSTFGTAEDIFGSNKSVIAASTNASLGRYAQLVASASHDGVNATALEQIFRVQHDLLFSKNVTISETITDYHSGNLLSVWWCLIPFSRGSVHLGSTQLIDEPVIDPRYFLADIDMTSQIAIGKQAQKFWKTNPMEAHVVANLTADPTSDEEWAEYISDTFEPNYHPIGTASMMARELGGVVDPELKVHGTSNVRVVDASVLPLQLSGHLTATLYALADRASEIIRACS